MNVNVLSPHAGLLISTFSYLDFDIFFFQRQKEKFLCILWFVLYYLRGSCECAGLNEMKLLSNAPLVTLRYTKSYSLMKKDGL